VNRLTSCIPSLIAATFACTTAAHANSIIYQLNGIASGQIGGTSFTNATVELTGAGDTANVTSFVTDGLTVFGNPLSSLTIAIGGIGTATITDKSALWAIPTPFLSSPDAAVIFGREDNVDGVRVLDSITGLGFVASTTLIGYTGATSFGPLTDGGGIGFPACGGTGEDPCVATTLGLLSFSSNPTFPATGDATFVATVTGAPEPGGLFLLGSELAAFAVRSRFRARHLAKR
jgi:hypothetical protein